MNVTDVISVRMVRGWDGYSYLVLWLGCGGLDEIYCGVDNLIYLPLMIYDNAVFMQCSLFSFVILCYLWNMESTF